MPADALQPPQDVGEMTAEDAAIRVQLVDDHVAQVLEELRPARVMREDPGVHHVRIGEHDVRLPANGAPRIRRRVAVVGEDADLEIRIVTYMRVGPHALALGGAFGASLRRLARAAGALPDELHQRVQLGELILRQCFRREQIQRARGGILEDGVQNRRVVAERLAGCSRRNRDDVAAAEHVLERFGLMGVEPNRIPRDASADRSRSSVPSGNGANDAAIAGIRCAAVTIASASAPIGLREAVRRARTCWSDRSLSPATTGRISCGMGKC